MNSLNDLNNYALSGVEFTDLRPTSFQFNSATISNPSITVLQNSSFSAPTGIDLVKITNPRQDIVFSVNLARLAGTSLSWTNPQNFTTTQVGNVYTMSNIRNVSDWNTIKNPTITLPTLATNNWTYTSTITYKNGNTKTWTTAVAITSLDQLTAASNYYYPGAIQSTVTGTPSVYEVGHSTTANTATNYSLLVTTSNAAVMGNLSSTGLNSSTWNNSTKTLTITGNINTVNSHLGNLKYWPVNFTLDSSFYLTYTLNNPYTAWTTVREQLVASQSSTTLSTATKDLYYAKNLLFYGNGLPQITDPASAGTSTYTYTIRPSTIDLLSLIAANGGGGTWNSNTGTYTITGNRSQVNSIISNVGFNPGTDVTSNFYTINSVTTPSGNTGIKTQNFFFNGTSTDINNMAVSRYYVKNTPDLLFPNTVPYISETVFPAPTYTIYLTSAAGQFGVNDSDAKTNWSYSGSLTRVNNIFNSIKFYPNYNTIGNQTFTYSQYRNGTLTATQTVGLTGAAASVTLPGTGVNVFTATQTFAPTWIQTNYLLADVVLMGGGGGGTAWGGGAGGQVVSRTNIQFPFGNGSFTIHVGTGGQWQSSGVKNQHDGEESWIESGGTFYFGAAGGGGGDASQTYLGVGGDSMQWIGPGNKTVLYSGGANRYVSGIIRAGGGGAGAGGAGGAATGSSPYNGGNGGAPVYSSITGTSTAYGGGGRGQAGYGGTNGTSAPGVYGHGGNATGLAGGLPANSGIVIIKFHT